MKKFSVAKILSLVCLCALLLGAFAFAVSATEDEKVEIVAANVYYGDVYQIMYAVNAPEGTTLKATDSKGNEIKVVPFTEDPTVNIDGVDCKVYILETGVAAQAIDEVITLTAEYGNKKAVKNYSILQYIYERCQAVEGAELEMLEALLAYAVKADVFFNGTTESFDKYQYVAATGVTANGVEIKGMYAPGATPFANIDAIEYDAEKYELVIKVNDAAKTLDELKALVVADEKIEVVVEIVEKAHEHDYDENVTAPTCTAEGYTTYTCSCGHSYTGNTTDALGHKDNNGDYKCDGTDCTELVLPEDGAAITVDQALAIGALMEHNTYTDNKYYVTGTITEVYNTQYGNFYITDNGTNKFTIYGLYLNGVRYDAMTVKPVAGDEVTVYGGVGQYNGTPQIKNADLDELVAHTCVGGEATCTAPATCTICGVVTGDALGHNYVDGVCERCEAEEPAAGETILPGNLSFTGAANKASADTYMKDNFPEWTITGKLGQTYGGYLGFGRSGDGTSSIKSSEISTTTAFTIKTVLKGNGSSGVATSTLTFTLVDASGNVVATGYADGSTTAAITPVDQKDTTYNISFTFVEGKTWSDVSNLVISFAKATGNIGLKSLEFIQ